jgi:hypothetical protein
MAGARQTIVVAITLESLNENKAKYMKYTRKQVTGNK